MVQKVEVVIFWIWVNASSYMWIALYWLLKFIPKPIIEFLEETHTLNVFKGATAYVLGFLLVGSKTYDFLSKRRKYKIEAKTKTYFDAYIMTGNALSETNHYESAIISYTKALDLNFDNDTATAKINEVKYLIDASHK